jgi:hypothetical protein
VVYAIHNPRCAYTSLDDVGPSTLLLDGIKRHSKHDMYGAAAGITQAVNSKIAL